MKNMRIELGNIMREKVEIDKLQSFHNNLLNNIPKINSEKAKETLKKLGVFNLKKHINSGELDFKCGVDIIENVERKVNGGSLI